MIYAKQTKAARALLGWSGEQLAAATGLSVTTIRNFESGDMSPRSATARVIREALEDRGIEFTEGEGVKRRDNRVKFYQGSDSSDLFFEDMLQTVRDKSGDGVMAVFKSRETMTRLCETGRNKLGRLDPILKHTRIRCLLPESFYSVASCSLQFRTIMKPHIGSLPYFIYGNKYAVVMTDDNSSFNFFVFCMCASAIHEHKEHFSILWDIALPASAQFQEENCLISA